MAMVGYLMEFDFFERRIAYMSDVLGGQHAWEKD